MAPISAQQDELKSLKPENFDFLCRTVHQDSGIVLDESKGYLLEARLPAGRQERRRHVARRPVQAHPRDGRRAIAPQGGRGDDHQ